MQKMRSLASLGLIVAPAFFSAFASAQEAPSIRAGASVSGVLSSSDPRSSDGRPFRAYRLDSESGKRYSVSLHSAAFDAYLRVGRSVGGVTDYLTSDDDSGDGTDALLRFRARDRGAYLIVVTSATDTAGKGGAFTLQVSEVVERAPVTRPIAIGDSATGSLVGESATWEDTSYPYALYTFRARKGQSLAVRLHADSVPGDVAFGSYANNTFAVLNATRTRSLFRRFTADADGDYAVKVMLVRPAPYVVHLDEQGQQRAHVVVLGNVLSDVLDPKVGTAPRPFHDWPLSAREGERLAISLRSSEFDTYLFLTRRQGDSLVRIAANDDAPGDGNNSRLAITVPTAGQYVIRVQSADSTGGGYSLRVDTLARVAQHLRRQPILAGQEIASSLAATDSTLDDGSPYQEWVYHATRAKERVMFTMRSSEFDTFLSVGQMQDGKFVEFSGNDDAADETRTNHISRVLIVAAAPGDFVVRANSMAANQLGAYTLRAGEPDAEARVSRTVGNAIALAARADTLARAYRIANAIATIDSALATDSSRVRNFELNSVCWYGTLRDSATRVLRYCERAVRLDPSRTGIMDSRGVARALSGDVTGAIQDFRAYAADMANSVASRNVRRAWADALQAGTPPRQIFSEAVRAELLKQ